MAHHVMVDLETMGRAPDGAIVSIGATCFDPWGSGVGDGFYQRVSLQSSVEAGMSIDPDTVLWWLQQSKEARQEICKRGESLGTALWRFYQWLVGLGTPVEMFFWAHSPQFDLTILETAFRHLKWEVPWSYRNFRDTRTVFALADLPYHGTKHHALEDAIDQALAVQQAVKKLRGGW